MKLTYEDHINALQEEVEDIVCRQDSMEVVIKELKKKSEDYRLLSERKYKLQVAIEHLKDLVEVAPEVQEALHPVDPFGEAS